jgi:DNA-binding FadR family transcriptional regulator
VQATFMANRSAATLSTQRPRPHERGNAVKVRIALERDLRSHRWQDGDKLPTERDLSAQYGVARNTVRRALRALEKEKLITRHVGRGTFKSSDRIRTRTDPFEIDSIEELSPADVIGCRLIFEPGLVSLVVERATKADFDRMVECLKRTEASASLAEFEHWDAALHEAIAVATHNHAVISMSRSLAKVRQRAEWGVLKARGMTPDRKSKLQKEHRAIVAALRNRDQSQAQISLRDHILHVRSYMFGE